MTYWILGALLLSAAMGAVGGCEDLQEDAVVTNAAIAIKFGRGKDCEACRLKRLEDVYGDAHEILVPEEPDKLIDSTKVFRAWVSSRKSDRSPTGSVWSLFLLLEESADSQLSLLANEVSGRFALVCLGGEQVALLLKVDVTPALLMQFRSKKDRDKVVQALGLSPVEDELASVLGQASEQIQRSEALVREADELLRQTEGPASQHKDLMKGERAK